MPYSGRLGACALTILATFFAVLNQGTDGAIALLYSDIYRIMAEAAQRAPFSPLAHGAAPARGVLPVKN